MRHNRVRCGPRFAGDDPAADLALVVVDDGSGSPHHALELRPKRIAPRSIKVHGEDAGTVANEAIVFPPMEMRATHYKPAGTRPFSTLAVAVTRLRGIFSSRDSSSSVCSAVQDAAVRLTIALGETRGVAGKNVYKIVHKA